MRADEFDAEYANLKNDNFNKASIHKPRQVKFTLRHLNKLKKMRSAQDLERIMRMDTLEIIYGSSEEAAGGMGL